MPVFEAVELSRFNNPQVEVRNTYHFIVHPTPAPSDLEEFSNVLGDLAAEHRQAQLSDQYVIYGWTWRQVDPVALPMLQFTLETPVVGTVNGDAVSTMLGVLLHFRSYSQAPNRMLKFMAGWGEFGTSGTEPGPGQLAAAKAWGDSLLNGRVLPGGTSFQLVCFKPYIPGEPLTNAPDATHTSPWWGVQRRRRRGRGI